MDKPNPTPGPQARNPNKEKLYGFALAGFVLLVFCIILNRC